MNCKLHGLRVLNTRPLEQGIALSRAIEEEGGTAIVCPALDIHPTDKKWIASLPNLNEVDQAIFISANAVNYCFAALQEEQIFWPPTIQIIAIGQATSNALLKKGIQVSAIPEIATSEHLLQLEIMQRVDDKTILIFKGNGGRALISDSLIKRGANLSLLNVYTRQIPSLSTTFLDSLWQNNIVDIILFTSQQAMQNIFYLLGKNARHWLCTIPCLVISERLATIATSMGLQTIIISKPEAILETLQQFNQGLIHGK